LRRNSRYIKAHKIFKWLEKKGWSIERAGYHMAAHEFLATELRSLLSLCNPPVIDDPNTYDDNVSLPNPDIPRHKLQYCPIERYSAVVMNGPGPMWGDAKMDELLRGIPTESPIPKEYKVTVDIDARCKLDTILAELKKALPSHLGEGRDHIKKYK